MIRNKNAAGHALAVFTVAIWGTTFISTKILLTDFTPVEILFIRFAAGYAALSAVYPKILRPCGFKRELYFAAAGLAGVTVYFLLENVALTYTLASNAGVIVSASPFFTAILASVFIRGENLHKRFFTGFIIATSGIFLIGFNGNSVLKLNPVGDVLALLAAAAWAVYSVLIRRISLFGYSIMSVTKRTFLYGILFMVPAILLFGFRPDTEKLLKPVNMFNMLYLGLGASALCFATWNAVVKSLGAITASVYIYLVPVIAVIASAVVLKENITFTAASGAALILTGLLISEGRFESLKKLRRSKKR